MTLRVEAAGPLLLVQDRGRPGNAHLGVPPSGALDFAALALGNRLVGNPEGAAGLEVLVGRVRLRAESSVRLALTGGLLDLQVDGRPAAWGTPVSVAAGSRIEVGQGPGLRGWLAVAGGVEVLQTLGSRSTDTLTGLGPAPLEDGAALQVGVVRAAGAAVAVPAPPPKPKTALLDVVLGPRHGMFLESALPALESTEYTVAPASNRTALRLDADVRLERTSAEELPSEGLVTGAVQVPANGKPLIFLADHPVTGGYPVIAVVTPESLAACAQLRPGDPVRLRARRAGPR